MTYTSFRGSSIASCTRPAASWRPPCRTHTSTGLPVTQLPASQPACQPDIRPCRWSRGACQPTQRGRCALCVVAWSPASKSDVSKGTCCPLAALAGILLRPCSVCCGSAGAVARIPARCHVFLNLLQCVAILPAPAVLALPAGTAAAAEEEVQEPCTSYLLLPILLLQVPPPPACLQQALSVSCR